ncbi:protein jag [Aerococcaceae bacterium zg-ZUI334]|uniref:RNA-binding cell elongation regulator Jag/EloR n=1 Tax=Aerococcaceae bacterium zg-252 TaxID=2796928 RepID=UPI001B924244|nr:protein jag [Aerococcaceae bacterium zg-ZUI334]
MEHSTTVRAETVEKAIKIALTKLNITREEAQVNVISEGKKGLFGFGKQDAIVEVSTNHRMDISAIEEVASEVTDNESEVVEHEEKEESSAQVEIEDVLVNEVPVEEHNDANVIEIDDHALDSNAAEVSHESVARYLEEVIRAYGAETTIEVENTRNQVIFNIQTDKSGLIIGKHGKIINALQVLAQVMVHQYDRRRQSIILNIGDYRDRRANVLEQIAERTAKEVLRTKQSVVLDPLPSYERKQIHAYLSKVDHIETHSEGRDPNRYLVVEYKA